MKREVRQKNTQERIVYLTDVEYLYSEIKREHEFQEALIYQNFFAKKFIETEKGKYIVEHNLFNVGKIIKLKSKNELIENPDRIYEDVNPAENFISELTNVIKNADKIVLITKPAILNFLLLNELLDVLEVVRETRTIYYIPVYSLKTDFVNDKCFFISHAKKENIVIDEDIVQNMENIEKYISESKKIIDLFYGENYISKIINSAYLYAASLEKKATNEKIAFENDTLYDLGTLQRDLFLRYGIAYEKSYAALEYLYKKGLITYYESDTQVLPEGKKNEILDIVNNNPCIDINKQRSKNIDAVYFEDLDDAEVYAIIPTPETNIGYIDSILNNDDFERNELQTIYKLICNSLKCIFNVQNKDEVIIDLMDKPTILDLVDFLMVCGFTGTEIAYMLKDNEYSNENDYINKNEEKKKYILDHKLTLNISDIYDFVKELRNGR